MTDTDFDDALEKALAPKAAKRVGGAAFGSLGNRITKKVDKLLAEARKDPAAWTRANRADIEQASHRRRIARKLAEDVPEFTEDEHAEFLTAFVADPATQKAMVGEWSEEKKAKWLRWINHAIPVLKFIAAVTPPPYNLAVILFIVVLTLIAERRLQPAELAGIFAPPPNAESVPTVAV